MAVGQHGPGGGRASPTGAGAVAGAAAAPEPDCWRGSDAGCLLQRVSWRRSALLAATPPQPPLLEASRCRQVLPLRLCQRYRLPRHLPPGVVATRRPRPLGLLPLGPLHRTMHALVVIQGHRRRPFEQPLRFQLAPLVQHPSACRHSPHRPSPPRAATDTPSLVPGPHIHCPGT